MNLNTFFSIYRRIESPKVIRGLWAVLIVVWLSLNLQSLGTYPVPQLDDAWIGSTAVTFIQTGHFGLPIFGDMFGSSENYVHLGRLFSAMVGITFKVFGTGLLQGRAVALVGAAVSGWLLFHLGNRLYGPLAGHLASILYLFSWHTFYSAHFIRPETWLHAAGIGCVLLLVKVHSTPSARNAFFLGLLSAIFMDIYFTMIYYAISIGLITILKFIHQRKWKLISSYGIGGVLGFLYWLIVHLMPDSALAIKQWGFLSSSYFQVSANPLRFLMPIFDIPQQIGAFINFSRLGFLEIICFILGAAWLAYKSTTKDRSMLSIFLVFSVAYIFIAPAKGYSHLVLFTPFLAFITAAGASKTAKYSTQIRLILPQNALVILFLTPLIAAYIGGDAILAWRNRAIDFQAYTSQLRTFIPLHSSILGEGQWYFAFLDGQFTSDHLSLYKLFYIANYHHSPSPDIVVQNIMQERKIDVILLDEWLSSFYYPTHSKDDLWLALEKYATVHCELKGVVEGVFYGVDQNGPAPKRTQVFICPSP